VHTEHLGLLLVDFFLGELHDITTDGVRLVHLKLCKNSYKRFLERCKDYKVIDDRGDFEAYAKSLTTDRTARVELGKREVQLKRRQREVFEKRKKAATRRIMEEEEGGNGLLGEDEELERENALLALELSAIKALNNLTMVEREMEMVKMREEREKDPALAEQQRAAVQAKDPGLQMYEMGPGGAVRHMGKMPQTMTLEKEKREGGYSGCRTAAPGQVMQKGTGQTGHGVVRTHENVHPSLGSVSANARMNKRDDLKHQVFQPHWTQPSESLDEYVDRMMPHALSGGTNDPNQETEEERDRKEEEEEEKVERDDEEHRAYIEYWDNFKEENPTGSGNRYNQG